MGRNYFSLCHSCKVQLMHLRGKESKTMHQFANAHYNHKDQVEIIDDYVQEPPEDYEDVFDGYQPTSQKGTDNDQSIR